MGRDTVQLETAINTISHEYLLEFTLEYGIPEALHLVLPGPEDRVVDFPEGKIGAAKVSHFEINCRVLNIIPTLSLFCVFYTPSFNSGWMSFSKRPGKNTPQCYTKLLDSLKSWNNRFFWVDESVFLTVVDWRTNAPKDGMPATGTYSVEAVRALDTHHMDLFSLIHAPNPTKVKVGSRPRAPHEVHILTLTANRVIEMDDPATASDSSGVPPTIERSPLDFSLEAGASDQGTAASEVPPSGDVPAAAAPEPSQLGLASTTSMPEDAPTDVSDPDPLCFADPLACLSADVAQSSLGVFAVKDLKFENASSPTEVGLPGDFLGQYNVNLARQVVLGSQLRLRFEQEAKLLRKSVAQVARRDKRIEARELEIKNLEALIEIEADMKRAAEDKSAGLIKELEDMRARFLDLQAFADVVFVGVAKEAEAKFVATLQSLKDLKYPLLDQLEGLKDAPMDIDTRGMPHNIYATSAPAPLSSPSPCIRRSDGIPVSVPTVVPQGFALLLVDAATQTDLEDT
nr:hypothetical protein [Tanacetum cinerariifolium]